MRCLPKLIGLLITIQVSAVLHPHFGTHELHPTEADKVNLELYYESLCPDCRNFLTEQVYPAAQKVGEILNVTLVPYGNAVEEWDGEKWIFTCQHGPKECDLNLVQACAISALHKKTLSRAMTPLKHPRNASKVQPDLEFVHCIESSEEPTKAGRQCSKKSGLKWNDIEKCVSGAMGNRIMHDNAVLTEGLNPHHDWVPWIVLNGEHTAEIQSAAENDLVQLICETYKGQKPKGCSSGR